MSRCLIIKVEGSKDNGMCYVNWVGLHMEIFLLLSCLSESKEDLEEDVFLEERGITVL